MEEQKKQALAEGLWKKAVGYESVETQEEYALVEGDLQLVKRKVIRKEVPPDITALKLLWGDEPPEEIGPEEIERERTALREEYLRLQASGERTKNKE